MRCGSCGADGIAPGSRFCDRCGRALTQQYAPPPTPPMPRMQQPAPSPPPYQQPRYEPPAPGPVGAQQGTNGLAIASMVLGILWIYWIGSVLALVFGYMALGQIRDSGGAQGGRGMAIAGVVLGWVGVGFLVISVAFLGMLGASS